MKPAFPIYHDDIEDFEDLTDEQMGRLIRLVCKHSQGVFVQPDKDIISQYKVLIRKVDRDAEKYAARCEQNRQNVNKRKRTQTTVNERKRTLPTETETETKTETNNIKPLHMYLQRNDSMEEVLKQL